MRTALSRPALEKWLVGAMWAVLLLLLFLPLVVTPSTLFAFVVGKATYFRALCEILFVLWAFLALAGRRHYSGGSWILRIFVVYILVSLVSAFFGASFQRSFWSNYERMGGVFDLIHWFLLLFVLSSLVRTTAHWRLLLNVNLGISLLLGLLGLAERHDIRVFQSLFWYFETKERLDITLGNPAYVGAYMLVNLLVALAFMAHSFSSPPAPQPEPRARRRQAARKSGRHGGRYRLWMARGYWTTVLVVGFWVMMFSGTMGAFLGLCGALIFASSVYAIWGSRRKMGMTLGVSALVLLCLMAGFPVLRETGMYRELARRSLMLERLGNVGFQNSSGRDRLIRARIGLEAFASSPVLGWGPENFAFAYRRYERADDFAMRW